MAGNKQEDKQRDCNAAKGKSTDANKNKKKGTKGRKK